MRHRTLCISFLAAALVWMAGCASEHQPGSPVPPQQNSGADLRLLSVPVGLGPHAVVMGGLTLSETKTIKANNGGDVSIGLIRIRFLPHTILQDTDVTITLLDQEQMRFRVEPADLALLQPVRIELEHLERTDHVEARSLRIARMAVGAPQLISTELEGNKRRVEVTSLGDFALVDQDLQGTLQFVRYLAGPGYETKLIEAARGGEVRYDRYRVTIPAGALAEDTYITVRNPGTGYLMCDLEPHMTFLLPVELELDLHGLSYEPYTDWTVFWLNTDTGLWENQGGTFAKEKLTVPLGHFSRYAAGRAGW